VFSLWCGGFVILGGELAAVTIRKRIFF